MSNPVFNIDKFNGDENLFIAASAGTGKTYTIQQVVARLILKGLSLDQILIVTYTEKAAGELKDRIRKKIEEESLKSPNNLYLQQALHDIHRAPIGTIHSFCEKVTKEFAYETNVPFIQQMISDSAVEDLINRLIRDKWIHDELFTTFVKNSGDMEKFTSLLISAVQTLVPETTNVVDDVIIKAGDHELSLQEISAICEAKNYEDLLLIDFVANTIDILENSRNELITKSKKAADLLEDIRTWVRGHGLYNGATFRINAENFHGDIKSALASIVDLKNLLGDKDRSAPNLLLQKCLYVYLKKLYREWEEEKHLQKVQSFNDMIRHVYHGVTKPYSLLVQALRLKYRFAIIDEFQDTNELQWSIFKKIFMEAHDGLHHIMVVGDPKQSIYSFQGADINVYTVATAEIGNGRELKTNWRSSNQMIEACNKLFSTSPEFSFDFEPSDCPPTSKPDAVYDGFVPPPFLISESDIEPKDYAETVVNNIIDFCTFKDGKTKLQIPDKETHKLRNLKFSDFAILGRNRSELEHVEQLLKKYGLPFLRYKDDNLFKSRECAEWSALLKAIDVSDYSERNRNLLYTALLTDFWGRSLDYVKGLSIDNSSISEIETFLHWHNLSEQRRWAELEESIYTQSPNMAELYQPENLQSLNKIQQVGDYIVDYLYTTNCSLEEIIRHLDGLAAGTEDALKDSNIVAKGTDLDVIQTMTIHASKGLEFPIVISVAGERGHAGSSGPYQYTCQEDGLRWMSFSPDVKEIVKEDTEREWHRLFYVAFTRATHLMIMPCFAIKKKTAKGILRSRCKEMEWLVNAINRFCDNDENKKYYQRLANRFFKDKKQTIQDILLGMRTTREEKNIVSISDLEKEISSWKVWKKFPHATSYSQIAHGTQDQESDEGRIQKDESFSSTSKTDDSAFFPRGAELGNAMHKIFELVDFEKIGNLSIDDALQDKALREFVIESFQNESLEIDENPGWIDTAIKMVWNTLNANLQFIEGANRKVEAFHLNSIDFSKRRSEMLFHMNMKGDREKQVMDLYCKGFIDLLFQKNGRYCILDWKSDVLDNYDENSIWDQMLIRHYNVQQVLYTYVLIQWLKSFHKDLSETEIFDQYFGGIYYVFFRGCKVGETSGIMSSTFSSYSELETLYHKVIG